MFLWGGAAFIAFLMPKSVAGKVRQSFGAAPIAVASLACFATLASLPIETATIGNGWSDALDPGIVHDVLFDTGVGQAWQAQMTASLILLLAFLLPLRLRSTGVAFASGLGLSALALTGHASMNEGSLEVAHRANDVLHLLAGGGWLGALVPLVPVLRLLSDPDHRREAQLSLRRFSTVGHGAVALVIVSGIINTMLILGHLPTNWSSRYQALLALKVALVAGMSGLAIINRYVFVPRIRTDRAAALNAIRLGSIVEIGFGIIVIALVAVFGVLEPV